MEKGIFQVDLAKMLGVDEMTVVNWEIGGRIPCSRYLERIRRVIPGLDATAKNSHSKRSGRGGECTYQSLCAFTLRNNDYRLETCILKVVDGDDSKANFSEAFESLKKSRKYYLSSLNI